MTFRNYPPQLPRTASIRGNYLLQMILFLQITKNNCPVTAIARDSNFRHIWSQFFKWTIPGIFFTYSPSLENNLQNKNCRLQRDLNSDHRRRWWTRWPLDQGQQSRFTALTVVCYSDEWHPTKIEALYYNSWVRSLSN